MRGQIFNLYHMEDGEGVQKSGFNSRATKIQSSLLIVSKCSKFGVLQDKLTTITVTNITNGTIVVVYDVTEKMNACFVEIGSDCRLPGR